MMLGHVIGGLALFGGSNLAAIAVALTGMSGMRHLRKLVSGRSFRVVHLDAARTSASQSHRAATPPTSCNWTAANTPKFADQTLPVAACMSSRTSGGGFSWRLQR